MIFANFSEGNFQSVSKRHGLLTLCFFKNYRPKNENRALFRDYTTPEMVFHYPPHRNIIAFTL